MTALLNRKKPLWVLGIAVLVGIGGILYGYDIGVISGALLFIQNSIPMTDAQVGVVVGAVLAGGLVGTLLAGPLTDSLGRRVGIAVSSVIFIIGVLCIFLAHSFATLLIARLLLGVGVGVVAVAVPLYVTELMPKEYRGKYVSFFQLFLTLGITLAYFVDLAFTPSGNWRGMFSIVLIPATILLVGVARLPESPRWLVSRGNIEQARQVLLRTHSKGHAESVLISIYESLKETPGTWVELLSSKLLLPLFIGVAVAVFNQWTGINIFLQYAPDILKRAGLGSNFSAMLGSVGIGIICLICTTIALLLVDRVGRRPLLILGVSGIVVAEIFLGFVNYIHLPFHMQGILSLMGLFAFVIFFAIGPGVVVWLAISELLPTRVRGKGIAVCLFFSSLSGASISSLFPDLRDWFGMAGTYWLCAGLTFFYLLLTIFIIPETKAKSLEDIQGYFQSRKKTDLLDISKN